MPKFRGESEDSEGCQAWAGRDEGHAPFFVLWAKTPPGDQRGACGAAIKRWRVAAAAALAANLRRPLSGVRETLAIDHHLVGGRSSVYTDRRSNLRIGKAPGSRCEVEASRVDAEAELVPAIADNLRRHFEKIG